MPRSLRLFTLLGTPVRAHYSWPIALVFITFVIALAVDLGDSSGPDILVPYVFGVVVALFLAASVLVHEFAHVTVARRVGLHVSGITLFALGGVSHISEDDESPSPRTDVAVSLAGPIVSLIVGLQFLAIRFVLNQLFDTEVEFANADAFSMRFVMHLAYLATGYIAIANIIIGLLNLLPFLPLDGGRIFSAILWRVTGDRYKARRAAALTGQAGAAAIITYGAYNLFFGETFPGIWLTAIGVFLMEAALRATPRRHDTLRREN